MSDLDVLRELVGQLPPPNYEELVAVARKRRRRSAMGAAAGAGVVILAVGMTAVVLSDGQRAHAPAQNPTPARTDSPSTVEEWTPERIRAEGTPENAIHTTESGLTARLYVVCDGSRCEGESGPAEDMHLALEVAQEGRSALFDLHYSTQPWVRAFDEDSVIVQDPQGEAQDQSVRYRLLQADGAAEQLQLVNDPAPAEPGPGVFVIDDFSGWNAGMDGVESVYLVDDRAGTLRPLDVPEDIRYWGPNVDEFLWGVSDDCRVSWVTDGTLEDHQLDCQNSVNFTFMHDEWFPVGWLRPGRMVLAEQLDDRMILHVSLDRGSTWQRIPVRGEDAVPGILRQLG